MTRRQMMMICRRVVQVVRRISGTSPFGGISAGPFGWYENQPFENNIKVIQMGERWIDPYKEGGVSCLINQACVMDQLTLVNLYFPTRINQRFGSLIFGQPKRSPVQP